MIGKIINYVSNKYYNNRNILRKRIPTIVGTAVLCTILSSKELLRKMSHDTENSQVVSGNCTFTIIL